MKNFIKIAKTELFTLLNQADDELLQIIYALLLKVKNSSTQKTSTTSYQPNLFLQKLELAQKTKPFSNIQNSTDWQKQIRDEWE